jgi:DamX protein
MHTLLTQERSQKLDLFIHLLTNLRQPLIICGAEGIGKTTFLNALQDCRREQWPIYAQQGSSNLSFESIIMDLNRYLNLKDSHYGFDLTSLRHFCEKQQVILIIDDAGELAPGLIGELIGLSESINGLRLVFAMTYDEFHIKRTSDKAVDECHFIELPPLNLAQCRDYLQNLSAQPGANFTFQVITDNLVTEIYRETHGIPGKILNIMPKFNQQRRHKFTWLGIGLAASIVTALAFIGLQDFPLLAPSQNAPSQLSTGNAHPEAETKATHAETPATKIPLPPIESPSAPINQQAENQALQALLPANQPEIKSEILPPPPPLAVVPYEKTGAKTLITAEETSQFNVLPEKPKQTEKPKAIAAIQPEARQQPLQAEKKSAKPANMEPEEKPAVKEPLKIPAPEAQPTQISVQPEKPKQTEKPQPIAVAAAQPETRQQPVLAEKNPAKQANSEKPADNRDWIMAQPAEHYTLQVMVLSSKASADQFLKKYREYKDLTYYPITRNNQEKFVLIYGSFNTANEAKQIKSTLPQEFQQALEKRFRSVQNESRH